MTARRWVFVSSAAISNVAELLLWLRQVVDRSRGDVVVLRRRPATAKEQERGVVPQEARPGVEAAAERLVRHSIRATVELVDDAAAEVPGCDGWAVGIRALDPVPLAVLRAGEESGVPGVCRHQDGYPFDQTVESRTGQVEAADQQRIADRNRAQAARDAARASARATAQRRRDAAVPAQRTRTPGEARQRAWEAHLARQGAGE